MLAIKKKNVEEQFWVESYFGPITTTGKWLSYMLKLFYLPPFPSYYVLMSFRAVNISHVSRTEFSLRDFILPPWSLTLCQCEPLPLTLAFFIFMAFIATWHVSYWVVCGPTSPTRLWRPLGWKPYLIIFAKFTFFPPIFIEHLLFAWNWFWFAGHK